MVPFFVIIKSCFKAKCLRWLIFIFYFPLSPKRVFWNFCVHFALNGMKFTNCMDGIVKNRVFGAHHCWSYSRSKRPISQQFLPGNWDFITINVVILFFWDVDNSQSEGLIQNIFWQNSIFFYVDWLSKSKYSHQFAHQLAFK